MALIGKVIEILDARAPTSPSWQVVYGAGHVVVVVGGAALAGWLAERQLSRLAPPIRELGAALLLKPVISVRALAAAALQLQAHLESADIAAARAAARVLVSRPTHALGTDLLASAGIESVAENAADSVVAPLLYYATGGLPAAFAYRAANTLDSMIGYHGPFEHRGKVAARLDDLLNLVPARLTAGLLVAAAALAGGDVPGALRTLRRDAGAPESPNAGWPMSAMAGALGVRLEKPGAYVLGAPLPRPDTPALDQAVQLLGWAAALMLPVVGAVSRLRRPSAT